ncbi:hypothetical protein JOM56_013273 [Amanita muscaria]
MLPSPSALFPLSANVQHTQQCMDTTPVPPLGNLLSAPNPTQPAKPQAANSDNTAPNSNSRAGAIRGSARTSSQNALIPSLDIPLQEPEAYGSTILCPGTPKERARGHIEPSALHSSTHDSDIQDLPMIDLVATSLSHGIPLDTHSVGQQRSASNAKGKQPQRGENVPLDKGEGAQNSLPSQPAPDYSPFIRFMSDTFNNMCHLFDTGQKQTHEILEELRAEQERLSSLTEGLQQRLCELPAGRTEPDVTPVTRVPSPPPAPRRPRRRGVPSRPNVSDGDWHYFRESIRTHLKKLLQVEQLDRSLLKFKPLTEEEMEALHGDNVAWIAPHLVLSADNFRLDMSQPVVSIFNTEAQDVFVEDFLHAIQVRRWYSEQEIPAQLLTYEAVMNALATHLKHVWRIYKEESSMNPEQVKKTRQLRSARSTRKRSLFLARYEMMEHLIKQDPGFARHRNLMCRIGTEGISSDETDREHQPIVYRRVSPSWRGFELQNFLWRLDELIFEASKNPINSNRRFGPGQRNRHRVFGIKVNTNSIAPANLPKNCYNNVWLQGLREWQRKKLNMQPEYDFSLLAQPSGQRNAQAGPSKERRL